MADQKHTPGPWHVEGSWNRPSTKEAGHLISHGLNSYGDGPEGYVCRTISTSPEDVRLIAAAPDLLAAAQLGLAQMEVELERIYEANCLINNEAPRKDTLEEDIRAELAEIEAQIAQVRELEASIAQARAAIAKATGGE